MGKKSLNLLSNMVIMAIILSFAFSLSSITVFAYDEDFIEIRTVEDLYNVRNDPSANYLLMNDIDLREATAEGALYDNNGKGWDAIPSFTGIFDGNGHTIDGANGERFFVINTNNVVLKDIVFVLHNLQLMKYRSKGS